MKNKKTRTKTYAMKLQLRGDFTDKLELFQNVGNITIYMARGEGVFETEAENEFLLGIKMAALIDEGEAWGLDIRILKGPKEVATK